MRRQAEICLPGKAFAMQTKRGTRFTVMVVLCLLFLLSRILDLCLFTEPGTSFVTLGPAWLRYLPALLLAVLSYLVSRGVTAHPLELTRSNRPLLIFKSATRNFLIFAGIRSHPTMISPTRLLKTKPRPRET